MNLRLAGRSPRQAKRNSFSKSKAEPKVTEGIFFTWGTDEAIHAGSGAIHAVPLWGFHWKWSYEVKIAPLLISDYPASQIYGLLRFDVVSHGPIAALTFVPHAVELGLIGLGVIVYAHILFVGVFPV